MLEEVCAGGGQRLYLVKMKKIFIVFGLFVLLIGIVSAVGQQCGYCEGDAPETITVSFSGVIFAWPNGLLTNGGWYGSNQGKNGYVRIPSVKNLDKVTLVQSKYNSCQWEAIISDSIELDYTEINWKDSDEPPYNWFETAGARVILYRGEEGWSIYGDVVNQESVLSMNFFQDSSVPVSEEEGSNRCDAFPGARNELVKKGNLAGTWGLNIAEGGGVGLVPGPKPEFKVELYLASDYIKETQQTRLFTPSLDKATAFDDISCKLIVDKDEALAIKDLAITVKFIDGAGNVVQSGNVLGKFIVGDKGYFTAGIGGWANGRAPGIAKDNEALEKLIKNPKLTCEITVEGYAPVKSDALLLSNCVHLWGSDGATGANSGDPGGLLGEVIPAAKFGIVIMGGESMKFVSNKVILLGELNRKEGFEKTSPFREYNKELSYYADLAEHDDTSWPLKGGVSLDPQKNAFDFEAYDYVQTKSSCKGVTGSSDYYIFYNNRTYAGYTQFNQPAIFINPTDTREVFLARTAVHEFGHAFGGLDDEYNYSRQIKDEWSWSEFKFKRIGPGEKNCVKKPVNEIYNNGYYYNSKAYGDTIYNNNGAGCYIYNGFFTPSERSIMGGGMSYVSAAQFNVISCYFLVRKLDNSLFPYQEGLDACMDAGWNTIKPDAECLTNDDCTLDQSDGCATCDSDTHKCFYYPAGESCAWYNKPIKRIEYGACGKKDTPESKAFCDLNPLWECAPGNEYILRCLAKGFNGDCVVCSNQGKCEAANQMRPCTGYLNGVVSNGYCMNGKCEG